MKSISSVLSACGVLVSVGFALFGIRAIGLVNRTEAALPQMRIAKSEAETLQAWLDASRMAWEANLAFAALFVVVVISLNMTIFKKQAQ